MAEIKDGLYYTKEHEWVKIKGDVATAGIDDFAQSQLTDIVFVELPENGKQVNQFESYGVVESVKAVSDVFAPVSGEIIEVNTELESTSGLINEDPFGKGWIVKLKIDSSKVEEELKNLMDAEAYKKFIEEQ